MPGALTWPWPTRCRAPAACLRRLRACSWLCVATAAPEWQEPSLSERWCLIGLPGVMAGQQEVLPEMSAPLASNALTRPLCLWLQPHDTLQPLP